MSGFSKAHSATHPSTAGHRVHHTHSWGCVQKNKLVECTTPVKIKRDKKMKTTFEIADPNFDGCIKVTMEGDFVDLTLPVWCWVEVDGNCCVALNSEQAKTLSEAIDKILGD